MGNAPEGEGKPRAVRNAQLAIIDTRRLKKMRNLHRTWGWLVIVLASISLFLAFNRSRATADPQPSPAAPTEVKGEESKGVKPQTKSSKEIAREQDLKKILKLVKEIREISQASVSTEAAMKKARPLEEELNGLAEKLTGLDRKKNKRLFDQKAFEVLLEAAQKFDPPFYAVLKEAEARRKKVAALVMIKNITSAMEMYYVDNARYPSEEEGILLLAKKSDRSPAPYLQVEFMEDLLRDPWGHPYVYNLTPQGARPYALFSSGPDGLPGTPDDLTPDTIIGR